MASEIKIHPSNSQRESRRMTRSPNRVRRLGGKVLTVAAVGTTILGIGHALDKHNHIKSASTMAEIESEVGHIPAGIIAIKKTETPDVEEVKYIVQTQPEKNFVSSVAADMHPIAPNQDPQDESAAINTYLAKPDSLHPGEEINMLVDINKGEILPSLHSVENDG